jgi:hypothetical protein
MARSDDDNREIPVIERWEDMWRRPNYSQDIDGSKDALQSVLAPYLLTPLQPCGLSNCRTPNGRGYLIRATDGRETNIGVNCGKKHFPEQRAEFVRNDRIVRERDLRSRAAAAKEDAQRVIDRVDELRKQPQGADWVCRCIAGLKRTVIKVDPPAWSQLVRRANTGRANVTVARRSGKSTSEIRVDRKGQTRTVRQETYVDVNIGAFTGLGVLSSGRDLRELLIERIDSAARELLECDPDRDGYKPLNQLLQKYGDFDSTFEQAQWAIDAGREFFTPTNLALLPYLASANAERHKLEGLTVDKLLASHNR